MDTWASLACCHGIPLCFRKTQLFLGGRVPSEALGEHVPRAGLGQRCALPIWRGSPRQGFYTQMMREVRKEALEPDSGPQPLSAGVPGGQQAWALRGHTTWLGLSVGSKRLTHSLPLPHPHMVLGRRKPINQPIRWPKTEPTLLCGGQAEGREERRKHFRIFLFSVLKSFLFKTKINL